VTAWDCLGTGPRRGVGVWEDELLATSLNEWVCLKPYEHFTWASRQAWGDLTVWNNESQQRSLH